MLPRKLGGFLVPAEGAAHAAHFIRRDGFAVSRAAQHDPPIALTTRNCLRGRPDKLRIIDRFFTESPVVFNLVSKFTKEFFNFFLVAKTGVITAERDSPGSVVN
jgi:hypothetical protein